MRLAIPFVLLTLATTPALAAEQPVDLKPGPGLDAVQTRCAACHSLDYVRMNSPFLTAEAWKAEVTKMRTAFGAEIDDAEAATIVNYLAVTYGPPGS
jgi:mono/diheme cytochrome c family protein